MTRRLPSVFWYGVALVVAGQVLTLYHLRPLSDGWYTFVWLGYVLAGDGWVFARDGRSLLFDRRRDLGLMALVSAALWWLLEASNLRFGAWSYSPSPDVPDWAQAARSTVAFATLIPATWVTLLLCLPWFSQGRRTARSRRHGSTPGHKADLMILGLGTACILGAFAVPQIGLGLFLVGLLAAADASCSLRGRPSLLAMIRERRHDVPLALAVGAMLSGLVGEAWNYPADPKWTYDVPAIDFAHVFEMPLLGYLGYALLAFALYASYHALRPAGWQTSRTTESDPLAISGL